MSKSNNLVVLGHTASVFLVISYLICIAYGLVFSGHRMVEAWAPLLPGFEWLTISGFIFGLIGSYLYGWYIALLWVPLRRFFANRYV